jgi:hypothetical protein
MKRSAKQLYSFGKIKKCQTSAKTKIRNKSNILIKSTINVRNDDDENGNNDEENNNNNNNNGGRQRK